MAKSNREAQMLIEYINQYLAGKKPAKPILTDRNMQQLLVGIDLLVSQDGRFIKAGT